tara:strand:- start:12 stop:260 length:249 start_codon:yes stop_codon:yes gene_type:complete
MHIDIILLDTGFPCIRETKRSQITLVGESHDFYWREYYISQRESIENSVPKIEVVSSLHHEAVSMILSIHKYVWLHCDIMLR